jgi:uncharacterized Rmd1/YagE family protein
MGAHVAVVLSLLLCSVVDAFRQGSGNCLTCGPRTTGRTSEDSVLTSTKRDYGFGFDTSRSNRRKMGPPQRKLNQEEVEEQTPGRVSVYSVGASIDLSALRAHVFRRGFGRDTSGWDTTPELVLSRRSESSALDDEVLHITNAPFSISTDPLALLSLADEETQRETAEDAAEPGSGSGSGPPAKEAQSARDRAYERLSMLTQDTFYFEYGCVVFWGMAEEQERHALAELAPFVCESSTPEELEKR